MIRLAIKTHIIYYNIRGQLVECYVDDIIAGLRSIPKKEEGGGHMVENGVSDGNIYRASNYIKYCRLRLQG